jgi:hypothetical protein
LRQRGSVDDPSMVDFQSSAVSKPKRRKASRGDIDSVGEMKATGRRFGSFAHTRRGAVDSDARRSSAGQDGGSSGNQGGGKAPGGLAWADFDGNERKLKRAENRAG